MNAILWRQLSQSTVTRQSFQGYLGLELCRKFPSFFGHVYPLWAVYAHLKGWSRKAGPVYASSLLPSELKTLRIYDAVKFTRDFCEANGIILGPKQELPEDPFIKKMTTKPKLVKDNIMKEYLEYSMGGGKVKSAKQFLENDRKVLRYYAKFEGL